MKILYLFLLFILFGNTLISKKEKSGALQIEKYSKPVIDSTLIFDQLKIKEKATYTGGASLKNGKTKTNGIIIKKTADNKIEYLYTQLINWKKQFDKKGVALLTSTSDSITTINNRKKPAYKFTDTKHNIIIYITKHKILNLTKAKVYNLNGQQISVLMFYK